MKVLVAEAAPARHDSLFSGLRRLGYRVEAIALDGGIRDIPPRADIDIVVIDPVKPDTAGLLTLHELREACPQAHIVILSPSGDIQDRITSLIQGADEILVKPFDLAGLHAVLQEAARPWRRH